jgi:hypothetical protein
MRVILLREEQIHGRQVQLTDRLFHATEAVRAMIARKALEELAGAKPSGRVKPQKQDPIRLGRASASRRPTIDLSYPAPPRWRPATATGATSFHFALSSTSKVGCKPGIASGDTTNGALAFERYVTAHDPSNTNRAVGAERYIVDDHNEPAGYSRTAFVISNISADAAEREAFWVAAHAAAATPSPPRLEIRPACGEVAALLALASEADTPDAVRIALHELADKLAIKCADVAAKVHSIDLDEAGLAWARTLYMARFGARRDERLIHLVRPRGGVLQWRIEAEFPEELGVEDDRIIAETYGDVLDDLSLRYTIAAHDPTHRNDLRNRHPHILIYPGGCRRLDDGRWAFGGGKLQPGDIAFRLGELDAEARSKLRFAERSAADVTALRNRFASIVNVRLEARGLRRRYDPRSYRAMGIEQAPGKHLGSAAAALVDKGHAVEIDRSNAVKAWVGRQQQIAAAMAAERALHAAVLAAIDAADADPSDPSLAALRGQFVESAAQLVEIKTALASHDLHEEMARSAAERLAAKSGDMLAAIAGGMASAAEARAAAGHRARNELALAHLGAVEEALEPHADTLAAARRDATRTRAQLRTIEGQITAEIERRACEQAARRERERWAAQTVLSPARQPAPLTPDAHFEALVEHLHNQRSAASGTPADRFVHVVAQGGDRDRFVAIGLRASDRELVGRQPYLRRFDGVLREAGKRQADEIGRVIAYIAAHGEARLADEGARPTPRTVARHYRLYREHPTFRRLLPDAIARFDAAQTASLIAQETPRFSIVEPAALVPTVVPTTPPPTPPIVAGDSKSTGSDKAVEPIVPALDDNPVTVETSLDGVVPPGPTRPPVDAAPAGAHGLNRHVPSLTSAAAADLPRAPVAIKKPITSVAVERPEELISNPAPGADEPGMEVVPTRPDISGSIAGEPVTGRDKIVPPTLAQRSASAVVEAAPLPSVDRRRGDSQQRLSEHRSRLDEPLQALPQPDPSSVPAPTATSVAVGLQTPASEAVAASPESETARPKGAPASASAAPTSALTANGQRAQSMGRIGGALSPKAVDTAPKLRGPRGSAPPHTPPAKGLEAGRVSPLEQVRDLVRARSSGEPVQALRPTSETDQGAPGSGPNGPQVPRQIERQTLLQSLQQIVDRFRMQTLYAQLAAGDRERFDVALQAPLRDIAAGRVSMRIEDGALSAAAASEDIMDRIRDFAITDAGYWLLVRAAEQLPDTDGFDGWQLIDQRGSAASPAIDNQARGLGD